MLSSCQHAEATGMISILDELVKGNYGVDRGTPPVLALICSYVVADAIGG